MHNNSIEVKGLKRAFGKIEVLRGVDFAVERGTIFALLGSNGEGKTTTIKILSTLLSPDGGSAVICGFDVQKQVQQVKTAISLTGQFAAVDEILTGRENLVLIGTLRHIKDPRKTACDLLTRFGLSEAADRRVGMYSGGMRSGNCSGTEQLLLFKHSEFSDSLSTLHYIF